MNELKMQVESILFKYSFMKNQLNILEFELRNLTPALRADIIEGNTFALSGNERGSGFHISDRTADMVVDHVDRQRDGRYYALTAMVHDLNRETTRVEYYISQLPEEEAAVIRWFYFDGLPWAKITENADVVQRTLERRKKRGLDKLVYYYSILDKLDSQQDIRTRMHFISYIHEEQYAHCTKLAVGNLSSGKQAMLYIISGCHELWQAGLENFFDFETGIVVPYKEGISSFSDDGVILLRLAYHLAHGSDWDMLGYMLRHYFAGLGYIHLELAIEALKLAFFPEASEIVV